MYVVQPSIMNRPKRVNAEATGLPSKELARRAGRLQLPAHYRGAHETGQRRKSPLRGDQRRPYGEGDITHNTVAGSVTEAFAQVCRSRGENVTASPGPSRCLTSSTVTRRAPEMTNTNS